MLSVKSTTAAILVESGGPLVIDEVCLPKNLEDGQVLVELITSGICGAQINEIDAIKGPDKFLPHLLGHEGYAKVIETGPKVFKIQPGDYVIMHWRPSTGIQSAPPVYMWRGKTLNAGWVTTFNQHAIVSENRLTKIPQESQSKFVLPLLGCALTTALGVLVNDALAGPKDDILILGSGGVGLALIKVAKGLGIKNIVMVDLIEGKLELSQKMGAKGTVKFTNKNETIKKLKEIYKNGLPTIAIDTTGNTDAIEICYEVSSSSARVILVGVPKIGTFARIYTLPLHFDKILKGSHGGGSNPDKDIPFLLKLMLEGGLDFESYPLLSFDFSNVNEAITELRNGSPGRMILKF